MFRFALADGSHVDRIAAAPILGAGIWIGRIPRTTRRVLVSPTNQLGLFGFVLERARRRIWPALLLEGLRRRPRPARSALLTRLIGWRPESDNNLDWAVAATDFADFERWARPRRRAFEPEALDRPRQGGTAADMILVVAGANDGAAAARTLASLGAQAFPRWRALLIDATVVPADPRAERTTLAPALVELAAADDGTLVCPLTAGDTLPDYALAFVAEQAARHPETCLFHADEVAAGCLVLRPDACFGAAGYGRALFARRLPGWSAEARRRFLVDAVPPAHPGKARALRRILLETPRPSAATSPHEPTSHEPAPLPAGSAKAAIVILSCDRPALLARVVASIRARTPPGLYHLVIVDNGAPNGPATATLSALGRAPDVSILSQQGAPFDYSAFCNAAAAIAPGDVLVFLNDDTCVLSEGWLERLVGYACRPEIGAVGARLTFPDGRLQHVGVVVGLGGSAGHFGAPAPGDDPGWDGRNRRTHAMSAVTGACLAVERAKFEAVGGFDAAHLPVELSDVDLCLKLGARGWRTLCDPAVHLMHEESASRGGATFRRLGVYAAQREVFAARWRHVLRDDPAFHPGLSLYSLEPALG